MVSKRGYKLAIQAGVPLFGLMIGGVYLLSTFLTTFIDIKDRRTGRGTQSISERKFNLEEEHKRMMKDLSNDLNDYKLSRIPHFESEGKILDKSKDETKNKNKDSK